MARDERAFREAEKRAAKAAAAEEKVKKTKPAPPEINYDDFDDDDVYEASETEAEATQRILRACRGSSEPSKQQPKADPYPVKKPVSAMSSAEILSLAEKRTKVLSDEIAKANRLIEEEKNEIKLLREEAKARAQAEANEARIKAAEAQRRVQEAVADATSISESKNVPDNGEISYTCAYVIEGNNAKRYLMLDPQMVAYFAPGGPFCKVPVELKGGKITRVLSLEEASKYLDIYEVK